MAATLAESLAAGDPEAFAALYDRLAFRLLGAARTMTGSAAEAEDVVQDLFVELARGRARLAALDRRAVLAIAAVRSTGPVPASMPAAGRRSSPWPSRRRSRTKKGTSPVSWNPIDLHER